MHSFPEIIGWDTETYKGNVYMLCNSDGYKALTREECFVLLTANRYRHTYNVFYNLDFDAQCLLKLFLSERQLRHIHTYGIYNQGEYTWNYIKKRKFTIGHKKNNNSYYDIAQYFKQKLNEASKRYLNKEKHELSGDFEDRNWIRNNLQEISEYCIQDCVLAKELAEYFTTTTRRLFPAHTRSFFSEGTLGQSYLIHEIPGSKYTSQRFSNAVIKKDDEILFSFIDDCNQAYRGGLFDIYQRGTFDEGYEYDMNSAYPFQISRLYDTSRANIVRLNYYDPLACYSVVKVRMYNNRIPIIGQMKGVVMYHTGYLGDIFLTGKEYEFLKKARSDMEVIYSWSVYTEKEKLYNDFITNIYDERNKLRNEDPPDPIEKTYKIIMNSLYGKFKQNVIVPKNLMTIPNKKLEKILKTEKILYDEFTETNYYKHHCHSRISNILYASEITANTRLQLYEKIIEHGNIDDIIAIQTDSIISKNPLSIPESDKLGEWGHKHHGEPLVIQNTGVYSYPKTGYGKLRGCLMDKEMMADKESNLLHNHLARHPTKKYFPISTYRPLKIGECLKHTKLYGIKDIGVFTKDTKKIYINQNKKRVWDSNFKNCQQVLETFIKSEPIHLHGGY